MFAVFGIFRSLFSAKVLIPLTILVVIGGGYLFVKDVKENVEHVAALEQKIETQAQALATYALADEQRIEAQAAADAATAALAALRIKYEDVRSRTVNVPEDQDGQISDVLRSTLRDLDGLQPD